MTSNRRKVARVGGSQGGWVWDAVWENRVLSPEERPAAQDAARRLLWGRWQKFSTIFWPGTFGVWVLAHLFSPANRTGVQTAILVFGLVMAIGAQGGFVAQAKLRRWMRTNQLQP